MDLFHSTTPPLDLSELWQLQLGAQLQELLETTLEKARSRWAPGEAVARTVIGLHAHGFMFGRQHARTGLLLPGVFSQPLTAADLQDLQIPDDLSGL